MISYQIHIKFVSYKTNLYEKMFASTHTIYLRFVRHRGGRPSAPGKTTFGTGERMPPHRPTFINVSSIGKSYYLPVFIGKRTTKHFYTMNNYVLLQVMKQIFLIICLLFAVTNSKAQKKEKAPVWKTELIGAVNNYSAGEVEPTITYQPIPYAGITVGLLFCHTIADESYSGVSKDQQWRWSSDSESSLYHSFAFRPAIQFATPALILGKDKDMGLSFIVSPGLTIPLSANNRIDISYYPNASGVWIPMKFDHIKNKGGRAVFYHIKGMFTLDLDEQYTLSAGYTFSDFDLYSGGRNITIEGKKLTLPRFRFMHSFFVSIGYRF